MKTIDHSEVKTGMTVYYWYGTTPTQGPFTVSKVWRDHRGLCALLRGRHDDNDRTITLADDEDYGALYIAIP